MDGNTFYEEDIVSQFRGYSCNCVFYADQQADDKVPAFSCVTTLPSSCPISHGVRSMLCALSAWQR